MTKALMLAKLAESGLTTADAKKLHIEYLTADKAAKLTEDQFNQPTMLIPYFEMNGKTNCFWRARRLSNPKSFKKKPARYTQPSKTIPRVYFPPLLSVSWNDINKDPSIDVFITEGELKAASGCKIIQEPVMGLGGVWNWRSKKAKQPVIQDIVDFNWKNRDVYLVFDSDTATNPNVQHALDEFSKLITDAGAMVYVISLPHSIEGKNGLDDFLVAEGIEEFEKLIRTAQPYAYGKELFQLNSEVVWIRYPTMVAELSTKEIMGVQQFRDNYASRLVLKETSDDKVKKLPATTEWIRWPQRSEVYQVTYAPGRPTIFHDSQSRRVFNSWKGWGCEPKKGDIKPWQVLMTHLFGANKEMLKWFEQWCAYQVQHPGDKLYSAVVLWSPIHGSGKSIVGITLGQIFGDNYSVLNQFDLHSQYTGWAANKQFIMGDDITGTDKRHVADYIKTIITREKLNVNNKYMPTYEILDVSNYLFTSNQPDAFIIEDNDRRFFVWRTPDRPFDINYATSTYNDWLRGDGPAHLFHHLLNVDLTGFNSKGFAPRTDAKEEMIMAGKSDLAAWVHELKVNPDAILLFDEAPMDKDLYTYDQLLTIYDPEGKTRVTKNGIGRELTKAGFPDAHRIKADGKTIVVRPVRNFGHWQSAKPKAWTDHYATAAETKKKAKF